jgi:hypothetical protein
VSKTSIRAQSRKGEYSAAGPDGAKLAESWSFSAESNTVMMTVNPLSENPLNRSGLALRHRVIHPPMQAVTHGPAIGECPVLQVVTGWPGGSIISIGSALLWCRPH